MPLSKEISQPVILDDFIKSCKIGFNHSSGHLYGYTKEELNHLIGEILFICGIERNFATPAPPSGEDAGKGKSNDWHLGNIARMKEMAEIQSNLNDFKEECERLAGLVTFWQTKYNELATPFIPGKIDNNPIA